MAKSPKVQNPVDTFLQNCPKIWNALYNASMKPFVGLLTEGAQTAMRQTVAEVTGRSIYADVSNYARFSGAVASAVNSNISGRVTITEQLRLKKEGSSYVFNLVGRDSSVLQISSTMESLPGYYDITSQKPSATKAEVLSPIFAALEAVGWKVTKTNGEETLEYDLKEFYPTEEKEDPLGALLVVESGFLAIRKHTISPDLLKGATAFKATLGMKVFVDTDIVGQYSLVLDPYIEIKVTQEALDRMVQANDDSTKPFLALSWMQNAIKAGLTKLSTTAWSPAPAVDLRTTASLLGTVRKAHGKAKARVNENNYCIGAEGLPMLVPDVDNTEAYMKAVGRPELSEDGFFYFEGNLEEWANRVILVDWFNDVLLYTDSKGILRTKYMYGYVPLDKSSEYILLNNMLNDGQLLKETLTSIRDTVETLVSKEEAQRFLDPRGPGRLYNDGRISESFGSLYNMVRQSMIRLDPSDPEFRHENPTAILVKHFLGLDLDEIPNDAMKGACAHLAAYIRAAYARRTEIRLPIMQMLIGYTWFLSTVSRGEEAYKTIKDEGIKARALLSPAPTLKSFDIPNVDTGNLKGVMPHQARILSSRFAGVSNGSLNAAAGAGKTLMILADILYKKEQHPDWKPMIITKSRLVKSFISEINFFTKGKVNVVSLRPRTIRLMRKKFKIDTFAKFAEWIKTLPANTIFITSYPALRSRSRLFPDLQMPQRVFLEDIALPQFLHVIRLLGFEQVQCDESHLIKNMKSLQAQYAYSVMAQATEKVIASGTQVPNTMLDLLGQGFAMNPMIYGKDVNKFKERYDLSGGIVDDDNAALLRKRMQRFVQESTAYKEDWAFVLPDLEDHVLYVDMTPRQREFYALMLERAMIELKLRLEGKKLPPPVDLDKGYADKDKDPLSGEDDDEEGGDEEDEDDDEGGEDLDEEGRIMAAIDLSLAELEQFVVAPDAHSMFVNMDPRPSPDDLVSPLVRLVDRHLDSIYADQTANHSNNKAAVFGIHRVASRHVMRHSRWSNRMVHYTAGNEEAIRLFKTDPNVWILTADSGGLREGENLQMLSHIFDMQSPWAPGDYEQLVSRMYRPDPKGVYNKDTVHHYWCCARVDDKLPGVNTIKMARMIAKAISTARYKYDKDPRWAKVAPRFEELGLLRMSYEFIENATPQDLAPYLDAWEDFVKWETSLNVDNRKKVAAELEMENPGIKLLDPSGRVLDRNLFVSLAMREVKSTKTIRGSRKAYTLWEFGVTPADVHDLGLNVMGGQKVQAGAYVMTEFGPAIVQRVGIRTCVVELNGLRKTTLSRQCIALPGSDEGKKRLAAMIADPSVWKAETIGPIEKLPKIDPDSSLAPRSSKTKQPIKPVTPDAPITQPTIRPNQTTIKPPPKEGPKTTNPLDAPVPGKAPKPTVQAPKPVIKTPVVPKKEAVEEISTYLLNGFPSLVIFDPPEAIYDYGWQEVGDFVTVAFKSWSVAAKFLDALATKFFLSQNDMDRLMDEMEAFKGGRSMRLTTRPSPTEVRNFFVAQHKKATQSKTGKDKVIPYWLAIDREVKLAFSKMSHSPSVIRWIKATKAKNPSITAVKENEGFAVRTFSTLKEAADVIKEVGQLFDLPEADLRNELRELNEDIDDIRAAKRTPTTTPKKDVKAPAKAPVKTPAKAPVKPKTPVKKTTRR